MAHNLRIYADFARIYDAEMRTTRFHEMWKRLFRRLKLPGRRAIDLACGTGEIAEFLAGEGWEVEGVDASGEMLEEAARRGTRVTLTRGDMRTFDVGKPVDLVVCAFDSLNYLLEADDVRACFSRVASHLVSGGYFFFDVNTPFGLSHVWSTGTRHVREIPGAKGTWEATWEPPLSHLRLAYTTGEGPGAARSWEEIHTQRGWRAADLRAWLRAAGLRPRGSWDGKTLQKVHPASSRIHFLFRKA